MIRRIAGGLALACALAVSPAACGPSHAPPPSGPPPVALHLSPACDLAPAAGAEWVVEAKPRAIAQTAGLIIPISIVVPEARFRVFEEAHGGVDLRQIEDLCVVRYAETTLTIAKTSFDPARVLAAFDARSTKATTRTTVIERPPVVRASGEREGVPERLVLFGREAIAEGRGAPGPLRASEAFAFGKLRRAAPVLHGAALSRAAQVLGDAPMRAFLPGPFEGETAQGLGGLLRASTAVGFTATPVPDSARIAVRIVLTGAWGESAPAAAERLGAAAHVLSESAIGKLLALDKPLEGPRVLAAPEALVLEATLDSEALARGIHDALDADVADMMERGSPHRRP